MGVYTLDLDDYYPLKLINNYIFSYEINFNNFQTFMEGYFLFYHNYKLISRYELDNKKKDEYMYAMKKNARQMQKQIKDALTSEERSKYPRSFINTYIHYITTVISCGRVCIINKSHEFEDLFYFSDEKVVQLTKYIDNKYVEILINTLFTDEKYIDSEECIDLFRETINDIEFKIGMYGFEVDSEEIRHKDDDNKYVIFNLNKEIATDTLYHLLFRFGISRYDTDQYISLLAKSTQFNYDIRGGFDIDDGKWIIHIIFINHNKHFVIEINDNKFISLTIDGNLVNFNNYLPFSKTMPLYAPLLQYEKDGKWFVDCIATCAFQKENQKDLYRLSLKKTYKGTSFDIMSVPISISMLFCSMKSFNKSIYEKLNKNYETPVLQKFNYNTLKTKPKYLSDLNRDGLIVITTKFIGKFIDFNRDLVNEYKSIIGGIFLQDENKNNTVLEGFLDEHRLCGSKNNFRNKKNNLKKWENIELIWLNHYEAKYSSIVRTDYLNYGLVQYIEINLLKLIELAEINIIRGILSKLKKLAETNCWELQYYLTIMKDIIYFNNCLQQGKFYLYELIYMLQNDFIYSRKQLIKYFEIRDDLINDVNQLKVHQFMMGRGKTSVFTPLLAFGIRILKNKQPTVITSSHLVHDAAKFMLIMTTYSKNIMVNIFSIDEAKLRWLKYTQNNYDNITNSVQIDATTSSDLEKVNIRQEINIIDEFDSHHNYKWSVFNVSLSTRAINEHIILSTYVYYLERCSNPINEDKDFDDDNEDDDDKKEDLAAPVFTGTSIGESSVNFNKYFQIEGITNIDKFYEELNSAYIQIKKMKYKMDYGFDPKKPHKRLCIPYSRKDRPMDGSNFSNILLSIMLLFKPYKKYFNNKLTIYEIKQIFENLSLYYKMIDIKYDNIKYFDRTNKYFNELINTDLRKFSEILQNNMETRADVSTKSIKMMNDYNALNISDKDNQFIIFYFMKSINNNDIKLSTVQLNMSFQDIIYNNYDQLQFAYTGTAYMKLNDYRRNEKFVFKHIERDKEEDVEVKLAICQYGLPSNITKSTIIKRIKETKDKKRIIGDILNVLGSFGQQCRGIIDLAGIFVKNENMDIAGFIYETMKNTSSQDEFKKYDVIYLDNDQTTIYKEDGEKVSYEKAHDKCIYYYDQGHTVGTDILQPQNGQFGIIISGNTRMTDFAQAIFRFRKLNRGTYMTVFLYGNENTDISYSDLYNKLTSNENMFNDNQEYGLKYQLMKAMVRKESIKKDYSETDMMPEFMIDGMNDTQLIKRLQTNTIGLKEILETNTIDLKEILETNTQLKKILETTMIGLNKILKINIDGLREITDPNTPVFMAITDLNSRLMKLLDPNMAEMKNISELYISGMNNILKTNKQMKNILRRNILELNGLLNIFQSNEIWKTNSKLKKILRKNVDELKKILETYTNGLKETESINTRITRLYKEIKKINNLGRLRSIMMGSGTEVHTNMQRNVEQKTDQKADQTAELTLKYNVESISSEDDEFIKAFKMTLLRVYIVRHANCMACINDVATPMFNKRYYNKYKIDGKHIYMSYNFLIKHNKELFKLESELITTESMIYNGDRWCFVVFQNIVLIETELFALYYYGDILPVYDFLGNPINPQIVVYKKLIIDATFKKMIGIGRVKEEKLQISDAVDNLTMAAKILLKFNYAASTCNRYNISSELRHALDNVTVLSIVNGFIKASLDGKYKECLSDFNKQSQVSDMNLSNITLDVMHAFKLYIMEMLYPHPSIPHTKTLITKNIGIKYLSIWTINNEFQFEAGFKNIICSNHDMIYNIIENLQQSLQKSYSSPHPHDSFSHRSAPGARTNRSVPGARTNRSVPGARTNRSVPGARTNRSVPGARTNLSVPRARTNLSVPRARTSRSVQDVRTDTYRSVPGAHRYTSRSTPQESVHMKHLGGYNMSYINRYIINKKKYSYILLLE